MTSHTRPPRQAPLVIAQALLGAGQSERAVETMQQVAADRPEDPAALALLPPNRHLTLGGARGEGRAEWSAVVRQPWPTAPTGASTRRPSV